MMGATFFPPSNWDVRFRGEDHLNDASPSLNTKSSGLALF